MNTIKFTSRASVKLGDSYFTFEACIEKTVPENLTNEEYSQFKQAVWDEANMEVDNQIAETTEFLKKKR